MQVNPEIAFRNVTRTPAMERAIREGIAELEKVEDRIVACRVMVELDHRRHRSGNTYRVRVDVTIPGTEIVVSRPPSSGGDDHAVTAISEAFHTARSRVLDFVRRRRDGYHRGPGE